MRSFLAAALAVLGALNSGVARADDPLAGEWAGGFSLGADSFTVIGHVERGPDGLKGNWVVLPEGLFALEEIRLEGDRVRLRVARPLGALAVDARVAAGVIEGDVRSGERGGRLELRRFVSIPADRLQRYTGAYGLAGGERVYVQPWSEMMELTQLTFLDTRGRFRYLLPDSESDFFSGPGLVRFAPSEVKVRFHEEGGVASGLVWEEGGVTRTAGKLDLYGSEDVTFQKGDVSLAGRLLLPKGRGRHPAIVFAHGSGPQDRTSGLPFVHFLVERGIAILGYDKRGVGGSGGDWKQSGFETLADDLLAAVGFLKGRREIDPLRIGILGVSQGGWLGPLAASRSRDVAFVVSVSGPGVSPAEQENDRIRSAAREAGVSESEVELLLGLRRMADDYIRGKTTWEALKAALEAKKDAPWFEYVDAPLEKEPYEHGMWRLIFDYDPLPVLERLRCPVLALFGERDTNVLPEKNAALWEAALRKGKHRDHTVRVLRRANHILLDVPTADLKELPAARGFVPEYRATLEEWLDRHLGTSAGRR